MGSMDDIGSSGEFIWGCFFYPVFVRIGFSLFFFRVFGFFEIIFQCGKKR